MNPYILLVLGFFLIFLEFYIPGAILGVIGGLLTFASIVFFIAENDSVIIILSYIIGVLIGLALLFKFALWRIKNTNPERSIYSDASQEGFQASKTDTTLFGKRGVVLSDLKPGGYILIEGNPYQAISESGYIVKGAHVLVVSGQEDSLIVKEIN